ncbi:TPA: hypothetical protein I7245_21650 [Vibrio vulnificus]|uniref:hypothetical protein n=1 Tax=Vibrio vulnificus TaxID=672 RepID=UPI001A1DE531|nr:hypothetical protein [Vibrio vulnificus]WHE21906.1 hypothetical protein PVE41_01725 [Vibrio vulnificus]HAS6208562.1 hypothetical protein [Vibrio vulnificus]HAS6331931.1 hypothetical protein [Vibrio vulnificus]HAS6336597.1 hypothetical protein [Vibrio vulnificus]HAT8497894.1 hypothetical protein [Vibrio vulnificus]
MNNLLWSFSLRTSLEKPLMLINWPQDTEHRNGNELLSQTKLNCGESLNPTGTEFKHRNHQTNP